MRTLIHSARFPWRTVLLVGLLLSGLMAAAVFGRSSAKADKVFALPSITPSTITRIKGAPATRSVIATVSDAETPAGALTVVAFPAPSRYTVTNLVNDNGTVSADVAVTCAALPGLNLINLQVTDSDGESQIRPFRINVREPALSYSSPQPVSFSSGRVVTPEMWQEGFTAMTVSAPNFGGSLSVDQTTGVVSISRARSAGSYLVTVAATNFCGVVLTRSFTLIVANGNREYQGAVGEPVPPSAPAQGSKGSILVFNLYSSSLTAPAAVENTRITISNLHLTQRASVHLFFVGQSGAVADTYVCLAAAASVTFLTRDVDPGTRGFIYAVAVDGTTGSPLSFNYLTGKADIWLASGHSANDVRADSFQALYPEGTSLPNDGTSAAINFDGVSYSRAARTLLLEDVPDPSTGNDTLLVFNRLGGNLHSNGVSPIGAFRGGLYEKSAPANFYPFNATTPLAQFGSSLSDTFPLTTPSFAPLLSAGKDWRMVFHASTELGLSGLALNRGPVKLNKNLLTPVALTRAASLTVPVFPASCP